MAGKKFVSQASQGNTKPSASNVAQGGTDFGRASVQDRKTIRSIGDVKNIINQRSGATGSELIAQQGARYGLSQADVQRLQQSSANVANKSSQLIAQARSIEQQAAAKQAQIKAAQLAKKNEGLLRQIEELKGASDRVGLSNISSKQRRELRANYSQKIFELNSQLTRNRKQQVDILDIGIAKSSSIASESNQRRQQQSTPSIKQGTVIKSSVFSFTPSSLRESERRNPVDILESSFGQKSKGEVQGPRRFDPAIDILPTVAVPPLTQKQQFDDFFSDSRPLTAKSTKKNDDPLKNLFESEARKKNPFFDVLSDFGQGFSETAAQRAYIVGKTFPHAIYDEITTGFTTKAGEARLKKDSGFLAKTFDTTPVADSIFSQQRVKGSKAQIAGSAAADIVPLALGVLGPKVFPATPKPTISNTVKSTLRQQAPRITPTGRSSSIALDIFSQDIGIGSNRKTVNLGRGIGRQFPRNDGFSSTVVNLGKGTGRPPNSGPSDFTKAVFGETKKPRKITTLDDILKNMNKDTQGGKVITDKSGLQQILKQKTAKKTTQKTQQKQQPLLKETQAEKLTREFFEQQSKSAKKRQRQAFVNIEQIAIQAVTPQTRPSQKKKQDRKNTIPILAITNQFRESQTIPKIPFEFKQKQSKKQKQDILFPPFTGTRQTTNFPPFTPTTTTTIFPPTFNPPRQPPQQPPRRPPTIPGFPIRLGFDGFGFDFNSGRRQKLKKRFELNTSINFVSPLSSAPNDFGFNILSTKSNSTLEKLDKLFVKASKKKADAEFGTFSAFGDVILDIRPKKIKKKRKSNDFFDMFDF